MNKQIAKLVGTYYQLLVDHHKDRDCHWTIHEMYSYSGETRYIVEHQGYVYSRIYRHFDKREEAEEFLIKHLTKAIKQESNFVKEEYPEVYEKLEKNLKEILNESSS